MVVDLLKNNIEGKPGWHIVDGFPRNFENLDMWNKKMMKFCDVKFMLYVECSQEEMERRVMERGKSSGRSDDNPETMKKRINTFVRITTPLMQWFEKQGKVQKANAEAPKEQVF